VTGPPPSGYLDPKRHCWLCEIAHPCAYFF
jgi:hypothetical protein